MASETPGSTVSLVGQGSFLTKPSLHMVGCTGKKSNTFTTPPDGLCPVCKAKGQSQVLKTYRLNFTQSIFLCSDPQCIYPLGHTPLDNIIANTADLRSLSPSKPRKRNISELSPPSEPNVKRPKSDLPLLGQCSLTNATTSAQVESSTSLQVVSPREYDATPSGISHSGSPWNREVSKQNVQETSSSFSCIASVLNNKPSSPVPPLGLQCNTTDSSKIFSDHMQDEDVEKDSLKSADAYRSPNRLSETEGLQENKGKERREPEPHLSPVTKSDLPLLGQDSLLNATNSAQAESSTSLQGVPLREYDATPSGISNCGSTCTSEVSKQNAEERSGSFTSAVLNIKPSSPLPPLGLPCNTIDSSKLFSGGLQNGDVEMDNQKSTDAYSRSPNRLSENEGLEENKGKEWREPEPHSSPVTKTDLPLDQYSLANPTTSAQAESSKSLQVVPLREYDATPSGISTSNTNVSKQNVQETSFSSTASVLNSKLSSPVSPLGLQHNTTDTCKLFNAVLQNENVEMDNHKSTDAYSRSPNRLSETEGLEENTGKEWREPEPHSSPVTKSDLPPLGQYSLANATNSAQPEGYTLSKTEGLEENKGKEWRDLEPHSSPDKLNLLPENSSNLNESPGVMEGINFPPDSVPYLTSIQQTELNAQMKTSPQEASTTVDREESALPISGGSVREMELAQPCCDVPKSLRELCESIESHILQCTDKVQQNNIAFGTVSHSESNDHSDVSMSQDFIADSQLAPYESAVSPVPQQGNESEHILNKSVSPRVETSIKENLNDDPVRAIEPKPNASHLNQDSFGTTSTSYSHDSQPMCLSDSGSVDKCGSVDNCEQTCTVDSVMKDCSIEEITSAPLKVCHSSLSIQQVEDIEQMHVETTTPSPCSVEDMQTAVDSRLTLPGISCMADAASDNSSIGPEEAPLPEGHLSDQGIQHISSETITPSALVQDSHPKLQSREKPLNDLPCMSQSIPIEVNNKVAAEKILIPKAKLPAQLDLVYDCQKSECDRIPSSDLVHDDSSQSEACNTVCPHLEKDNCPEQEISPLPDNTLLETIQMSQDSVEPCGVNTSRNFQASSTNADNTILGVTDALCKTNSAVDNSLAEIPAPFTDSQIENTALTEGVEEKKTQPSHDTVADVEDNGSAKQAVALSPEAKRTTSKASFENAVLPDLLLDIQPEHRTEEPISDVPNPLNKCDADVTKTISTECKTPNKFVQDAEVIKMEIDPDLSDDKLQSTVNLSDTLSSVGTLNESIEIGPLDLSVNDLEHSQSDQIPEARTYENSQKLLQWKNKKSLCWLDCILSTLVHSRTLGMFVAKNGINKESIIVNLFAKYGEANAMYKEILKKNKAGKPTKSEASLNVVRMQIFDVLQPLLKCELGNYESPVFAFPLLLRLEPDFQKLFEHSFTWNFKCESCGYTFQERSQKTMTTFTQIVQDWRPLNAVHRSPCNKCEATDQRREMHLETLQSMFMLHFVEGLPSNDLKAYAFEFGEHWYEIKTVIRYRHQHFSTWMANDDDTWIESDDLKGSFCRRQQKFRMRAEDIHIVIWERSNRKNIQEEISELSSMEQVLEVKSENQTSMPQAEISPSDTSKESRLVTPAVEMCEQASTECSPQVALASHCILSDAATENPAQCAPVVETKNAPSVVPVSGSVKDKISNPLAGMEAYAADDVITLTLVEIPFDSTGNATELKQTNPSVTQLATNVLQLAPTQLPQDTDKRHGALLQAEHPKPGSSLAPVSTTEPIPVQPCARRKRNNNMPAATSTPSSKTFQAKKSIAGNLMGTLVKKANLFINSNYSNANRKTTSRPWQPASLLKESDVNGTPRKAENFDGFRARTVNNANNSDASSLLISKLLNSASSFNVPKEKPAQTFLSPASLGQMKLGKNGISSGMLTKDGSLSAEDKIRKLRLKLLKKLKAKKNELAMLEKVAKLQPNGGGGANGAVLPGGVNRREHLRGFLQELQDHIDNTDNESIGTVSSCTSICSSPGDADFFAELFSPSPADSSENGSKFLEMLADGYGISSEPSQQATGFNYPMNNTTPQSTSGADTLHNTFNQSSGEESLNLLSSSTMAMMNEDTNYLDSFADIF